MSCKDQEHKCTLRESKKGGKKLRKLRVVSNQKEQKKDCKKNVRFHHIESDRRISKHYWFFTGDW